MAEHDLIIRGGTVVDGTGAPARTADVAVSNGVVTEVGAVEGSATREIDADGALVAATFNKQVALLTAACGAAPDDEAEEPTETEDTTSEEEEEPTPPKKTKRKAKRPPPSSSSSEAEQQCAPAPPHHYSAIYDNHYAHLR
jgi:outer membrane biosynthesis protein TonB